LESLRSLHDNACEWRCNECSVNFERVPHTEGDPLALAAEIESRLQSLASTFDLCASSSSFPSASSQAHCPIILMTRDAVVERVRHNETFSLADDVNIAEATTLAVPLDPLPSSGNQCWNETMQGLTSSSTACQTSIALLSFAVSGWTGEGESVVCGICCRSLKLKEFMSYTDNDHSKKRALSPLACHRHYCPWTQVHVPEGVAGWEIALQAVEQTLTVTGMKRKTLEKEQGQGDDSGGDVREAYKKIRSLLTEAAKNWD
jgi:hypothetical protein